MAKDEKTPQRQLAEALDGAGGLKLIRIGYLADNIVVFTFDWQDDLLQFQARIIDVMQENIPKNPKARVSLSKQQHKMGHLFKERTDWTELELLKLDLPLYWCKSWLEREYKLHGSFMALEMLYGYSESTLSKFATREFGWKIKPRLNGVKDMVIQTWLESGRQRTRKSLSIEFKIAIGSVSNWITVFEAEDK
jgi:hypothetical protein